MFLGCNTEKRMEYYRVKCPMKFITIKGKEQSYFLEINLCMRNDKIRISYDSVKRAVILIYKGPFGEKRKLVASDVLKYWQDGKLEVSLLSDECPG